MPVDTAQRAATDVDQQDLLIRYVGVSKKFESANDERFAVKDVSLDIQRGSIVTLVGPSGCGKSTLLNLVAGLLPPTSGATLYNDKPVASLNRNVGYLTQVDHLLPWRTVERNVASPLEIHGMPAKEIKARVAELLELVGLTSFRRYYPSQLSGGMKKRTALARVLAYDPETLLMDEPFGALDAHLRVRLQIEFRELCKTLKKTVLFVTHDLDEAVALGDSCAVFSRGPGRIIATLKIPLPATRDLRKLRYDNNFSETCRTLWDLLSPEMDLAGHQ